MRRSASPLRQLALVIPNARKAAFNNWLQARYGGEDWFPVGLSATGNAPPTHWGMCGAVPERMLMHILKRLCQLASIAEPDDWEEKTVAQREAWLVSNIPAIRSATGIRMRVGWCDGVSNEFEPARVAGGFQRIGARL